MDTYPHPHPFRIFLKKVWRRYLYSPYISIRFRVIMISRTSSPWRTLFYLLWPIPWKFRTPPPLSVEEICANPSLAARRFNDYHWPSRLDIFMKRDTPLFALYRLYEVTCAQLETEMFEGSKYIWCHQPVWPLSEMPDPQDPDPTRYAMLAAVVQSLLLSYNERLDLCHMRGYGEIVAAYQAQTGTRRRLQPQPHERLPDWVERVPPLAERLVLKRPDGRPSTFVTPGLKKWNIMGGAGEFFFV